MSKPACRKIEMAPKVRVPGKGRIPVGGLPLQHEHHPHGERPGKDGVHPRGRNGVGKIGHDLESIGPGRRQPGQRHLDGVPFDQVERLRMLAARASASGARGASGHARRPRPRPLLREGRLGQRAQAGADLDHGVAPANLGQLERLAHDVAVDEEVLARG